MKSNKLSRKEWEAVWKEYRVWWYEFYKLSRPGFEQEKIKIQSLVNQVLEKRDK